MPNVELKNWVVNKTRVNTDCLSEGNNHLSIHLSFSTTIPERVDDETSVVTAKLKVNAGEDNEFFFISLKADFAFAATIDIKKMSYDQKNDLLKDEAFPLIYDQLCKCVNFLLTAIKLKELNLPPYEVVKKSL